MNSPDEENHMSTFGKRKKASDSSPLVQGRSRPDALETNGRGPSPAHSTPINKNRKEPGSADERVGFLSPVSLTPAWESQAHPEDVMNFTNSKPSSFANHPPVDRWRMVHIVMIIYGIAALMPWNMFITAKAYFEDYKLSTNASRCSEYRLQFLNYLGITGNIPMLLSFINMVCHCGGGNSSKRIIWSLVIMIAVFILTIILAMIDSSEWPGIFFFITMGSVVILNMSNGVFQNCVYGLAAILPMKYTNAVVLGTNLSGIFTAVINIISMAASPNLRTAAVYYFITAVAVLLVAFDAYFALPLMEYYKYHQRLVEMKTQEIAQDEGGTSRPPYWLIIKKIWPQMFSVFFVFFISLTIFPAIQSNIRRIDFPIADEYWVAIFCFLSFNLFAFLGNLTSEWIKFPGPRFLWLPVLIRGLVVIPFFILSNYRAEYRIVEKLPMWLANDYAYIVGSVLFAFTSGYYSSLAMMYGPSLVEPHYAAQAGMIMAFCLITGIFGGIMTSLGVVKLVQLAEIQSTGTC